MAVPYSFSTATSPIPLANLDANFNTPITFGDTPVYLGNTTTTINGLTLSNLAITSVTNAPVARSALNSVGYTGLTGSVIMTVGTTAQRDAAPSAGYLRYNSTTGYFEGYNGSTWSSLANGLTTRTAVATTSGTNIDFTGIPSWVKRITVIFQGVSKSGTDNILIQLGTSGGIANTGYLSTGTEVTSSPNTSSTTAGFIIKIPGAGDAFRGHMTITLVSGNSWVASHVGRLTSGTTALGGGDVTLSGTLDRIRLTIAGADTFDAGSINIMYE